MDASYCLDGWNPPDPPPPLPEEEQRAFGAALRDAVLRRWPDYPWYEALDVLSVAAMYAQPYLEALMDGPWPATGMDGAVRRDLERALGCRLPAITGAADLAAAAKERAAVKAAKPRGRAAMAPKAPKPAARGTVPAKAPAGPAKPGRRTPGTAAEAPKAPVRNRSRKPPAAPPEDMTALSGALQAAGLNMRGVGLAAYSFLGVGLGVRSGRAPLVNLAGLQWLAGAAPEVRWVVAGLASVSGVANAAAAGGGAVCVLNSEARIKAAHGRLWDGGRWRRVPGPERSNAFRRVLFLENVRRLAGAYSAALGLAG